MKRMLDTPRVEDIVIEKAFAFKIGLRSADAPKIFNKYNISTAPVVNEENQVVGHLSERDCIKFLISCLYYDESSNRKIELIMSRKIIVADKSWDLFELERFFVKNHLRSAPVVDSENHFLGIVTRKDVLLELEKFMLGRQDYKKEISQNLEHDTRKKVRNIINKVS